MESAQRIKQILESNDLKVIESHNFNERDLDYMFKIQYTKPLLKPDLSTELKQIYNLGFIVSAFKSFDVDPKDTIRIWFTRWDKIPCN